MASNYKESTSFSPFCPTGTILPYLGNTLPSGWNWLYSTGANRTLKCSNSAYGTTFGIDTQSIPSGGISHKHNVGNTGESTNTNHFHSMTNYVPEKNSGTGAENEFGTSNTGGAGLTTVAINTDNPVWNQHVVTADSAGSGQNFSILNAYFTVHWIIKL